MENIPYRKTPCLRVQIIPGIYQSFRVEKEIVLGRDDKNDILLNTPGVSLRHAAIGIEGEKVWIEDLGSKNGTFVNDVRIEKSYLKDQDWIALGDAKIFFQEQEETSLLKKSRDIFIEKEQEPLFQGTRYAVARFFRNVFSRCTFPVHILISSAPIKNFPESMEIRESTPCLCGNPRILKVVPVFPGCLVSPCFQEVQTEEMPLKIDFWITPLSEEGHVNASLQFLQKGQILKIARIPFLVMSLFWHRLFFTLALLFPVLGILMDLPSLPLHRNLPYLVYTMVSIVRALGGPTLTGLFIGTFFLGAGIYCLLYKGRKDYEMVYEEILF